MTKKPRDVLIQRCRESLLPSVCSEVNDSTPVNVTAPDEGQKMGVSLCLIDLFFIRHLTTAHVEVAEDPLPSSAHTSGLSGTVIDLLGPAIPHLHEF